MREEFFRNYEARMTQSTFAFDGVPAAARLAGERGFAWGVVTNKSMRFTGR
jgi:phosphoglycolate phosphatase-like HAD superfamily hydrolase